MPKNRISKVSIIIPTYNRAWCIERAISSVLSQEHKDWELIIVDDGSTDNTKQAIRKYLKNRKIRYYYQKNMGVNSARNKGFDMASGDLIMPFDSDDKLKDGALKTIVEEARKVDNPKIGVLLFNCEDKEGRIFGKYPKRKEVLTYEDLIIGEKISGEKKSVIMGWLIKDLKYRYTEMPGQNEGLFWLSIAREYDLLFIPKTVRIYYTGHDDRLTGSAQLLKKAKHQHGIYELFLKNFKRDYERLNPKGLSYIYTEKGINEILAKQLNHGRESLKKALTYNRKKALLIILIYMSSFLPNRMFVKFTVFGHKFKEILK